MKLTHLNVKNFKGLRDICIPVSGFVCLTGHNNAGKSSILQALLCFFDGKKLATNYYFDPATDIVITASFEGIREADLTLIANEEHRERIRQLLDNDSITFLRRYSPEGTSRLLILAKTPLDVRFSEEFLDSFLIGKPSAALAAQTISHFPELIDQINAKTSVKRIKALIDDLARAQPADQKVLKECSLPTGLEASVRPLFPEPIYIPAVKDFTDDIKAKDSTTFGKLLGMLLNALAPTLQTESSMFANLNTLLNVLKDEEGVVTDSRHEAIRLIEGTIQQYVREHFSGVEIEIAIPPPEIRAILSSARIIINDGVKGELDSKGDGLKRSVTFSIIRSYAELKNNPILGSTLKHGSGFLILFEEPELYLHPSAQRVLFDALSLISQSDQVFVSTHSPLFFSVDATGTFVKIAKSQAADGKPYGQAVHVDLSKLDDKSRFQIISYETNNSAFFSSKVVLVEGDSDYLVFPHLAKILNADWCVHRKGIAVCRLNGKGSIRKYRDFFRAFEVRVIVLADLHSLLDGFDHFDVSNECQQARQKLLNALDKNAQRSSSTQLPTKQLKELAGSTSKREQWNTMCGLYADCLKNQATAEELVQAGNAFFAPEIARTRRTVLEDQSIDEVRRLKEHLLMLLRADDVFLLSKGTLENYYPAGISGTDKPSRALDFRRVVTDRRRAIGLCDQVLSDRNGTSDYEFDVVFSNIFE